MEPNASAPPIGVVLAAGLGTRMRRPDSSAALNPEQAAAAAEGVKAMIPVGRPLLDYILSGLADAGVTDVCLVVGPSHHAISRRYRHELVPTRCTIELAVQASPRGTADALLAAYPVVGDRPVLVVNGDNLYPVPALAALVGHAGPAVIGYRRDALIRDGNVGEERIARYALVWHDAEGRLVRIVEKPEPALVGDPAALVSMNSWRFSPAIFAAARAIGPSPRGELELQDAVQWAIDRLGMSVRVIPFSGGVLDLSSRGDVASVAARVRSLEARP